MKTRNFALCALGLAAAITFGGAATASAQARSDTRIPVRKDQPAPEPPKVDTIRIVRVDTVTLRGRVDTVTIRTRPDTVIQMQMLPVQKLPGWYFGLGAGVAIPYSSYRSSTKDGFDLQGQVGWFPKDAAFGLRLNGDGNFYNNRDTDCPLCPNPKQFQLGLDALLRFPLDRTSKLNPVLYFLGGGNVNWYSDFLPYRNRGNTVVTAGSNTYLAYPGLVLQCKPVGILELLQASNGKKERNDRIFAVPDRSPFEGDLQDIRHLPKRAVDELEKFFQASDALEDKKLEFLGWKGPDKAISAIKKYRL